VLFVFCGNTDILTGHSPILPVVIQWSVHYVDLYEQTIQRYEPIGIIYKVTLFYYSFLQ